MEFSAELGQVDQKLKERFLQIMDDHVTTAPFEAYEMFEDGFRLGAKMMIAIYQEEHP